MHAVKVEYMMASSMPTNGPFKNLLRIPIQFDGKPWDDILNLEDYNVSSCMVSLDLEDDCCHSKYHFKQTASQFLVLRVERGSEIQSLHTTDRCFECQIHNPDYCQSRSKSPPRVGLNQSKRKKPSENETLISCGVLEDIDDIKKIKDGFKTMKQFLKPDNAFPPQSAMFWLDFDEADGRKTRTLNQALNRIDSLTKKKYDCFKRSIYGVESSDLWLFSYRCFKPNIKANDDMKDHFVEFESGASNNWLFYSCDSIFSTFDNEVVLWIQSKDGTQYSQYIPPWSMFWLKKKTAFSYSRINYVNIKRVPDYVSFHRVQFPSNGSSIDDFVSVSTDQRDSYTIRKDELVSYYKSCITEVVQIEKEERSMSTVDNLKEFGFMLIKLDEKQKNTLRNGLKVHQSKNLHWINIRNNLEENITQMTTTEEANGIDLWRKELENILRTICEEQKLALPKFWFHSGLRSEFQVKKKGIRPLLNAQDLHYDVVNVHSGLEKTLFHSSILTMSSECGLIVIPKSHNNLDEPTGNAKYLLIPEWHVLLFSGKLIHAGGRYYGRRNKRNVRAFVCGQQSDEKRYDEDTVVNLRGERKGFILKDQK